MLWGGGNSLPYSRPGSWVTDPRQHLMHPMTSQSCVVVVCVPSTCSDPALLGADWEHSKTLDLQQLTDLTSKGRDIDSKEK